MDNIIPYWLLGSNMKYMASVIGLMMLSLSLSGCLQSSNNSIFTEESSRIDGEFVTDSKGMPVDFTLYESIIEMPFALIIKTII